MPLASGGRQYPDTSDETQLPADVYAALSTMLAGELQRSFLDSDGPAEILQHLSLTYPGTTPESDAILPRQFSPYTMTRRTSSDGRRRLSGGRRQPHTHRRSPSSTMTRGDEEVKLPTLPPAPRKRSLPKNAKPRGRRMHRDQHAPNERRKVEEEAEAEQVRCADRSLFVGTFAVYDCPQRRARAQARSHTNCVYHTDGHSPTDTNKHRDTGTQTHRHLIQYVSKLAGADGGGKQAARRGGASSTGSRHTCSAHAQRQISTAS